MPAVSKSQQRFMGMCANDPSKARGECPSKEVAREFATTKQKGLPEHKLRPHGSGVFTDQEFGQGYRVLKEKK